MVKARKPPRAPRRLPQAETRDARSLPLFELDAGEELERAKAIAKRFPLDACLSKMPGRPYWRAQWSRDGKQTTAYIGGAARLAEVQAAHELVRADMIAHGFEPPRARKRRTARPSRHKHGPPPRSQKPKGARGGRLSTAVATLRDSEATDHVEGDRSPVAANGSRRRR
jgi:hypothetical protein